MLHSHQNSKLK